MTHADAFLESFSAIERHLRKKTGLDRGVSFYQVVDEASRSDHAVRRFRDDLKEYADLRNAVVHERSDGHAIAEPNARAVRELAAIATLLVQPPRILPAFKAEVEATTPHDSVGNAVTIMRRHRYSQLPVHDRGRVVGVLTTEAIAEWLGREAKNDLISLVDGRVRDVMAAAITEPKYELAGKGATLFHVAEWFETHEQKGQRLSAILITETGRPDQALLGIITVHDLPKVLRLLKITRGAVAT